MEDLGSPLSTWLSIDQPPEPETGWYAVLRLHPDSSGLKAGAFYFGDGRWGKNHDIFARSAQTFADADAANDFVAHNAVTRVRSS